MKNRFNRCFGVNGARRFIAAFIIVCLAVSVYALFVYRLRPVVYDLAKAEVNAVLNDVANRAVLQTIMDEGVEYGDMVVFEKDGLGKVTALRTNAALLNSLRASIVSQVLDLSSSEECVSVKVPMGAVAGANILSGAGPRINVKMSAAKEVNGTFVSRFSETAINQSIHRLMFEGSISCTLLYPGMREDCSVNFSVVAAETVIVGDVPESYTYFSGVNTTDEAIDYYYNYR